MLLLRCSIAVGTAAMIAAPAHAAEANLSIEIPRIAVAEYHRPYVAVWLEKDNTFVTNVAAWYDPRMPENGGAQWLKDLRQWWRKGGRDLKTPADGITSATRAPGVHKLQLSNRKTLASLEAGGYELVVEAARQGGGREVLRLPFEWPAKSGHTAHAQGTHELGKVAIEIKP